MFFAFARRVALGCLVIASVACSNNGASNLSAGPPATSASVQFEAAGPLLAVPGQSVDVGVTVTGGDTKVSLWLEGDYSDASLSAGTVTTADSRATLTLHAPSVAATFTIRARVSGASDAVLDVSVSAGGFSTLRITPEYTGHRPVPGVTASVFVKSSCNDLAAGTMNSVVKDGTLASQGPITGPLTIADVPAGTRISVVGRIRYYALGCVDIESLVPSATRDVTLPLVDRPMALDQTNLVASFTFDPTGNDVAAWASMLDSAIAEATSALSAPSGNEGDELLDSMRGVVPTAGQPHFDSARQANGWDATASGWLSNRSPSIQARAASWMFEGKGEDLATLTLHMSATIPAAGQVSIKLGTFGKLDAIAAGMSVQGSFDWTADAADVVHLQGTVHLHPTALVARGADAHAALDVPGSTGVADALAAPTVLDCAGLAAALVGNQSYAFDTCDAACMTGYCNGALSEIWTKAAAASATAAEDVPITLAASAAATVDDYAAPASFNGSWVGKVGQPGRNQSGMNGVAQGQEPASIPH